MRLLADSSLHGAVVRALREAGHDVDDVRYWGSDPGDSAILDRAVKDGRAVVTSDKDFGELVVFGGALSVLVVASDLMVSTQVSACIDALMLHEQTIMRGALVIIGAAGARVRFPQKPA